MVLVGGCGVFKKHSSTPRPHTGACGRSLQAEIERTPPGATLLVAPCVYREQIVVDKPLTLKGRPGAEITGTDVWRRWRKMGRYWVSERSVPRFPQTAVRCMPGTRRCLWPEQVFLDGRPLRQVAENPHPGQFALDPGRRVLLGDDPDGHRVEVTVRRYWVLGKASGVTIEGFIMRGAANGGRTGALMNRMSPGGKGYADWTVKDNKLSDAHGAVISLSKAPGLKILDNDIYRGGQMGILNTGRGELIKGNAVHDNNTEGFDTGWEAGGMKTSHASEVILTSNTFYRNEGSAVWFDIDSTHNTISGNRIYDNTGFGIHYEISSHGEISGNVLWNNGWGTPRWVLGSAIASSNSSVVDIHDNMLAWNADGISVIGVDRGRQTWNDVHDVRVRRNVIVMGRPRRGVVGDRFALAWLQGDVRGMFRPGSGNRGEDNMFWLANSGEHPPLFGWGGKRYGRLSEFARTPGGLGSRYLTPAEKDSALKKIGPVGGKTGRSTHS